MAEHNYLTHGPKAFYNAKGQYQFCHSKDEEARVKAQGFTSANYVKSAWPKTAYNKKDGSSRLIGKIDATDAENAAAVASVTGDWTFDYVPLPEPPKPAPAGAGIETAVLGQLLVELAEMRKQAVEDRKQIAELQEAVLSLARPAEPVIEEAPAPIRSPKKSA